MNVLLDTTVLIDHLRGDTRAMRLLSELAEADNRIWAATPTRSEIIAGLLEGEQGALAELFEAIAWVDIDSVIADAAGEFARQFQPSHATIDTTDYLIAAAANSVGAQLITLNVRHFPMFEGLEPAYG